MKIAVDMMGSDLGPVELASGVKTFLDKKQDVNLALCKRRNSSVSGCGVYRSENAGMSSANVVRIHMAGNLRFLEEGRLRPRLPAKTQRRRWAAKSR